MSKVRLKILLAFVGLITMVLIIVGILLGQLFKSYYLNQFDERLQKETDFITDYVESKGNWTEFITKDDFSELTKLLDFTITLLTPDGDIVYSQNPNKEPVSENQEEVLHRIAFENRGEISQGIEAVDEKYNFHYYWKTIEQDGQAAGFVVVSHPLDIIEQINKQMWFILIECLAGTVAVFILIGSLITKKFISPIERAMRTATELAKGNYRARTNDESSKLGKSLNILARNLQEMEMKLEVQEDRLEVLIEHIGSGVLFIDNKGYVILINKQYKEFFKVDAAEFLYRLYYKVISNKEIIRLIEELFITEKNIKRQMLVPLGFERRHFDVYGAPIIGVHDEWKGVLVVFHDITELKKLEQVRKDFVANVSHELKTPITSIKGFSETLLDGAMKDEEALQHFLAIILKESDRMQSLIQELLDLSKFEQHEIPLQIQKIDIMNVLEETYLIVRERAEGKNITIKIHPTTAPIVFEGDYDRSKQIFLNLITNALTYTSGGGLVELIVVENEETVSVSVKDTGIGMEEEELPRIFERFYRIDKDRSRNSGGTGLGLAIVKHIIEAHKGTLNVESKPGKGTVFTVVFNKKMKRSHELKQ